MSCGVVPSRHIEFASSRRTLCARIIEDGKMCLEGTTPKD